MSTRNWFAMVASFGVLLLPAGSSKADLVLNGSFEQPSIGAATFSLFSSIPGWTPTAGQLELQSNGLYGPGSVAFNGVQWHEMDRASGATGIFQDLTTEVGQTYLLSFAYAPRPFTAAADNVFEVLWGGSTVVTLGPLTPPGGDVIDWQVASFVVTASATTTRLQFNDIGDVVSVGALLDNVSVVPEPSTWAIASLGVVALALTRRFRKSQLTEAPRPVEVDPGQ